jgi:hypothetical protein
MAQKTWASNDVLTAADMNLYASHEGGAWTSYTPAWSGGMAIGNGTTSGAYARASRTIHFRLKLTLGTTSAVTGGIVVSLPVAAEATGMQLETFVGLAVDTSAAARYTIVAAAATTSTVTLYGVSTVATVTPQSVSSATIPFTWANTDIIILSGTYESAT